MTSVAAVRTSEAARAPATGPISPALVPPPGNPRFPLFDGLRGVAVLAILAFHTFELTARIGLGVFGRAAEVAGFEAVLAFFAISGFLLYRPYASARSEGRPLPSTRRYGRRRALRILPGYWAVLTLLALFPGLVGVFTGDWWRYYGYLQLYSSTTQLQGIPVAWTLCVEVTFYLFLPLLAVALRRLSAGRDIVRTELLALAVLMLVGFGIQLAASRRMISDQIGVTLLGQISWIAIGMALAVCSLPEARGLRLVRLLRALALRPELCWGIGLAAFAGLMALVPKGGLFGLIAGLTAHQSSTTTIAKLLLQAILTAAYLLPAVFAGERRGLPRRLLAWAPITWLGVISYSFYLWHLTIAELIAWHRLPGSSVHGLNLLGHLHIARDPILYALTLLATGLVASLSYQLIELPFLRRKEPGSGRRGRPSILPRG